MSSWFKNIQDYGIYRFILVKNMISPVLKNETSLSVMTAKTVCRVICVILKSTPVKKLQFLFYCEKITTQAGVKFQNKACLKENCMIIDQFYTTQLPTSLSFCNEYTFNSMYHFHTLWTLEKYNSAPLQRLTAGLSAN